MSLKVISLGFGRTATMSLRMALNQLGFDPCYHMEDVLQDMPKRTPQWNQALAGNPDWDAIFDGFNSAVDWPVAAFTGELLAYYPEAKFILSSRSVESWYDSISQTILAVLGAPEKWPEEQREWLEMVYEVVVNRSLGGSLEQDAVMDAFRKHEEMVKKTIPAEKLLVFEAKDGWEPLCKYLGVPVPEGPYPRSNDRQEFFELMAQNSGG